MSLLETCLTCSGASHAETSSSALFSPCTVHAFMHLSSTSSVEEGKKNGSGMMIFFFLSGGRKKMAVLKCVRDNPGQKL